MKIRWRKILKVGTLFILGMVLLVAGINWWVYRSGAGRVYEDVNDIPHRRVALVLGTSQYLHNGQPNAFFSYRMQAAVELYQSGKVDKLIVSGDNGTHQYNETDAMRRELIRRGIPADAIVNDHAGFRTLDSVVRARNVFGVDAFTVVSQEFHVRRAIFIARSHGIDAIGYPARDPNSTAATRKVYFREALARVKAFLDCYVLGTEPKFNGPPEPINF